MPRGTIKGKIRKPNDYYERLIEFVKANSTSWHSSANVAEQTNIPQSVVATFFLRNFTKKFFNRRGTAGGGGDSCYEYMLIKLPKLHESKGAVAKAVWDLFSAAQCSMNKRQVLEALNKTRTREFSDESVQTAIRYFRKQGALIETGPKRYVINRNFKQRPTITTKTAKAA